MNGLYDEIRIALYRVWNRRWLALAVAWGICLLGWLVVALIPNTYASEAKLFVGQQAMLSTSMIDDRNDQRQQMDQIQQTLLSADNLEKVIRATKLGDNVSSDREMATKIVSLRENIEVKSDQPNVFNITVKQSGAGRSDGEAAALARDIAQNALIVLGAAGAAMAFFAWLVMRSVLLPLPRIGFALRQREPTDLTPIDLSAPSEVATLVESLNGFMARLDHQMTTNRNLGWEVVAVLPGEDVGPFGRL